MLIRIFANAGSKQQKILQGVLLSTIGKCLNSTPFFVAQNDFSRSSQMAIKDLIAQVSAKLPDEVKSEVGSILKSIENEAEDLQSSLTAANSESKGRKIELRELKTKLDDVDVEKGSLQKQIEELNEKLKDPTKDKELEGLRNFKKQTIQKNRQSFIAAFDKIKEHPNFEKAQSKFVIPEKDGEDKLDWSKIEDTDMEKNMNVLNDLNDLEYFAVENKGKPYAGQGGTATQVSDIKLINEKRLAGDQSWKEDFKQFQLKR